MSSLILLKSIIQRLGITDIEIKMDEKARQIVAQFKYLGQNQKKIISFDEIENAFKTSKNPIT